LIVDNAMRTSNLWSKNRDFFEAFQADPASSGYVKLTEAYTGRCDIYYARAIPPIPPKLARFPPSPSIMLYVSDLIVRFFDHFLLEFGQLGRELIVAAITTPSCHLNPKHERLAAGNPRAAMQLGNLLP
jgi:hypothetical protein